MSNSSSSILIVEDDPVTQNLFRRFLARSGFQVLVADNGEDAFNLTLIHQPDLVLLDLMMPRMDGFGFLELLRTSSAAGTPVIVTSALADLERQEHARQLGANEYLVKTQFTLAGLIDAIHRHLPPHNAAVGGSVR